MKGAKTEMIRRAYAALGRDARWQDVAAHVRNNNAPKGGGAGPTVSRQMIYGVRNQVAPMEWRGWDADRARAVANPSKTPDAPKPPEPAASPGQSAPVKHDHEIVALLNTAVDRHKLVRLLSAGDMARLDYMAREFGLAFDLVTTTFGLVANGGGFCTCNI